MDTENTDGYGHYGYGKKYGYGYGYGQKKTIRNSVICLLTKDS